MNAPGAAYPPASISKTLRDVPEPELVPNVKDDPVALNVVNAPVLPLIGDAVIVLLLNASDPAKVASVPVVGNVSDVLAVAVKDCVNAPAWVTLPAIVSVLALATPVPPLAAGSIPVTPVVSGMPVAFENNCVSVDLRSAVSAALWISTVSAASGTVFAV